jgi:hypothetical protein
MALSTVQYRVQFYSFLNNTTFAIGPLISEPARIKNIGWAHYLNDVPECFFTLDQLDPQVALLRLYKGKAHVRILRSGDSGLTWDVVWTGWGPMELDSNERDVVMTCYGYLSGLYWLHTDWDQTWTGTQMDDIINDLWVRAKTTLTQSNLNFVTTGTVEAPVTTSGGSTAIVLPSYRTYIKRILFALQELSALAASDTNNGVVFEITHSTTPTFNFWKNLGQDRTTMVWELGGAVSSFREISLPVLHRNQILSVGSPANDAVFRYDTSDSGDINDFGRRQEALYLSWVRDELELQRVTDRRKAMALREDIYLELRFAHGRVLPPGVTGAGYILGDRIKIRIDRGATSVDEYRLVTGVQVLYVRGAEHVQALTMQRPGA